MKRKITDTERLDWLSAGPREVYYFYDGWAVGYSLDNTRRLLTSKSVSGLRNLRKAIDAAMRKEKKA